MPEGLALAPDFLISVIIACFNVVGVVEEQLAALARQVDPGRWELVLADNGSTDGTRAHLAELAALYPMLPIRVIDASQRQGAGPARNAGVRAARGEVVAFCDADDVVDDRWVAEVRKALTEHDFIAGMCTGDRLNEPWMVRARGLDPSTALRRTPWAPGLVHSGAGNMAIRKDIFLRVGGFDADCRYLEDCDFCWRVQLSTGVPLVRWPAALVHMRLRGNLADTWRQGLHYGRATSWLRERYARVLAARADPATGASTDAPPAEVVLAPRRTRPWWREERPWDKGALGHLLWQLGWRVGRRTARLSGVRAEPLVLPGTALAEP
jgi:glycosyltransferase involved in cell wall biosynthesis